MGAACACCRLARIPAAAAACHVQRVQGQSFPCRCTPQLMRFAPPQGGVLYVRVKKAHNLVKKPWYKGGGFSKPGATLIVHVADQEKKSARAEGNEPFWVRRFNCALFTLG